MGTILIRFRRGDGQTALAVADPGRSITIGRDHDCDLCLDARKVSRRHVQIENRSDGHVVVRDLESHNGTFVNGVRITEATIQPGDAIACGEWQGWFEARSMPPGSMPQFAVPVPGATFDQQTDPANATSKVTTDTARQRPALAPPPAPVPSLPAAGAWKWEEGPATISSDVRSAPVDANPILRRVSESGANLDFRGLTELVPDDASATATALRPAATVDAVALRLVLKVTEALQSAESMDAFLQEMSASLITAARAKAVVVLLPNEDGTLEPRVIRQRRTDERVQLSRTVIDHAVNNRSALTTEDASADERFARGDSVLRFDLKAVLCVPLLRAGETSVTGALYLTRDLPFSNTERDLVSALAQLIAMGLERARLREEFARAEATRRSLERFHAPDVVRRLMMGASPGHQELFLEPLTATVLFCDLAGFTSWCETHEAEAVGRLLNAYLSTMTEIVFEFGGTVDKFIGDAIMCIFGAPFTSPDDPVRAVRCAMKMRASFRALVRSGACGDDVSDLDVHIGINSGRVVAGTVGSLRRMEYTALGDTVNTAARLESTASKGQILLGPATAALVQDQVLLRALGPKALKGKGQTLEVFEVPEES